MSFDARRVRPPARPAGRAPTGVMARRLLPYGVAVTHAVVSLLLERARTGERRPRRALLVTVAAGALGGALSSVRSSLAAASVAGPNRAVRDE